ncbi:MAG: chloride channel protein [Acidobacteriota bacterium]|nr:chloride channel protein [Acidobacteriota bacterium]
MDTLKRRLFWTAWDIGMGSVVGVLSGGASAGFLWLLGRAIRLRQEHLWLLALLPLFGLISAFLYRRYGKESEGGGSLILDEVLEFRGRVRSRLAPLVLMGTLLTHLGGGSAGREGTAVQMGASLARSLGKLPFAWLRLNDSRQRLLLMAGVSAGFGSLFGTPAAGAIFGMEVIAMGKIHYEGIVICAAASMVANWVCRGLGAQPIRYVVSAPEFSGALGLKVALFALPVAITAGVFSEFSHGLAQWTKAKFADRWMLRPLVGGAAVIALFLILREDGYLNLGLPFLDGIFLRGASGAPWAFAAKLTITCVTLGFGFKGGEVTPIFVIGALLGAALAPALHVPIPFLAAMGFITLAAAASNTPLASVVMGIELFGAAFAGPLVVSCFLAYVLVGHRGIYGGHRVHTSKHSPGDS